MIDILAFGSHPDDCEFFVAGTLLKMKQLSYKTGICDLSRGEAGTYGSAKTRRQELERASTMLSLDARITLDFPDGSIRNTEESRLQVIEVIRTLRPEVVFSFADLPMRHPDHFYCGEIVRECCYLAGLEKVKSKSPPFRPSAFIGFPELIISKRPDFVIDVTPFWQKRREVIRCYTTQVIEPGTDDSRSKTFARSQRFWEIQEARAGMAGAMIGVKYGEPFYSASPPGIEDPLKAFKKEIK
ncbi:MAG: bacillithiol biosynthesis deacetylase BshB1 [Candidatus Aminicenantes bacterium]|nr:bacillithiol biosynthesis deacetylase BshB1 [Candidatus Aminicenantes bacterium]